MKRALNYEQVKKLLLDEIERCPPDSNSARWFRHGLRRALRCVEEAQAYDQVAWERDLAVQQLKDYGVGLSQKNENLVEVTRWEGCKYNDACLTQFFLEDAGSVPLDRKTFYCADAEPK